MTSWHRICAKDINVLGSWGFTGNDLPLGVDMLPGTKIYKLPDDMSLRLGALSEPLTSCIRAFNRATRGESGTGTRTLAAGAAFSCTMRISACLLP